MHIINIDCITLSQLREVVQKTEQLPDDTPIVISTDVFNSDYKESDIDFIPVRQIIADEENIAFYH